MIATWMLYTLLVGALVMAAARCAESLLRLLGRPARWVWAAAVILSIGIPIGTALAPAPLVEVQEVAASLTRTAPTAGEPVTFSLPSLPAVPSLDRPLLLAWGGLTLLLLATLLYSMGRLHGRRREWQQDTVDGHPVLLASDIGPAVVGWWRMQIVVPAWVHRLDAESRALVLAHEEEHIRARDPQLMLAGLLAAMLIPWHLPLWYAWRRLRVAIELDCDARVLARGVSRQRYGETLLQAGSRTVGTALPALATFAERAGQLEERLSALAPAPVRRRGVRMAGATVAAAVLLSVACMMDNPLGVDLADPGGGSSPRWFPDVPPGGFQPVVLAGDNGIRVLRDIVHRMVEQRFPGASQAGGTTERVTAVLTLHPDRRLLSATLQVGRGASEAEVPLASLRGNQIESIEVLKGGVVGLENVGVIVVQLRQPGEPAPAGRLAPGSSTPAQQDTGGDWVPAGYIGQDPR